jgi:hypothetical protein
MDAQNILQKSTTCIFSPFSRESEHSFLSMISSSFSAIKTLRKRFNFLSVYKIYARKCIDQLNFSQSTLMSCYWESTIFRSFRQATWYTLKGWKFLSAMKILKYQDDGEDPPPPLLGKEAGVRSAQRKSRTNIFISVLARKFTFVLLKG